jgi:hypothetical protein
MTKTKIEMMRLRRWIATSGFGQRQLGQFQFEIGVGVIH